MARARDPYANLYHSFCPLIRNKTDIISFYFSFMGWVHFMRHRSKIHIFLREAFTEKTKGAFGGAEGAIQAFSTL